MKNTKGETKEEIKLPSKQLIPNSMRQAFISNLRKLRNENESKSLLISPQEQERRMPQPLPYKIRIPRKPYF